MKLSNSNKEIGVRKYFQFHFCHNGRIRCRSRSAPLTIEEGWMIQCLQEAPASKSSVKAKTTGKQHHGRSVASILPAPTPEVDLSSVLKPFKPVQIPIVTEVASKQLEDVCTEPT